MKLKSIGIFLLLVLALLLGCASPAPVSERPASGHGFPMLGWDRTDNLSIHTKDFKLDVLHILVMPDYILLICAVSGDLGKNDIREANVLDAQKQPQGQTRVTLLKEFKQGKLIVLTFFGNRQSMPRPLFSITGLTGTGNAVIQGDWHFAPVQLPKGFDDRGATFASGVISAKIGALTIFSDGNSPTSVCKGDSGMGAWGEIDAALVMTLSENGKKSCLHLLVSGNGNVREVSQEEYLLRTPRPTEAPIP